MPGAKNSVLKLMATTPARRRCAPRSPTCRDIADVGDHGRPARRRSGCAECIRPPTHTLKLTNRGDLSPVAPYELVERIRASINVLGPLLARCGTVRLSLPGGDDFGSRPIDMHLQRAGGDGRDVRDRPRLRRGHADRLHGADITFDFPSVGATENILTAAVLAKGTTVIDNAAREPEIGDLCDVLGRRWAPTIEGVGTSTLVVHGVEPGSLRPVDPRRRRRSHPGGDLHRRGRHHRWRDHAAQRPGRAHGDGDARASATWA